MSVCVCVSVYFHLCVYVQEYVATVYIFVYNLQNDFADFFQILAPGFSYENCNISIYYNQLFYDTRNSTERFGLSFEFFDKC